MIRLVSVGRGADSAQNGVQVFDKAEEARKIANLKIEELSVRSPLAEDAVYFDEAIDDFEVQTKDSLVAAFRKYLGYRFKETILGTDFVENGLTEVCTLHLI